MAIIINGRGRVGVRPPSGVSPSYLLDTYGGAAVAYSAARRLSSTYTGNAIRVRRSSDNAEQNIGFDGSGNLDQTALTTFVGAGNGFVTTIYDQSGNARNATQTTASNQPRIVLSGVVETVNSKPSINYLSNMWITNAASINTKSVFTVSKVAAFVNLQSLFTFASTTGPWVRSYDPNYYKSRTSSPMNIDDYTSNNDMYFNNHLHLNTDNFTNSHILSSFGDKTATFQLSTQYYGRQYNGKITEAILYGTDENAGYRTGINANMNTFYSIY